MRVRDVRREAHVSQQSADSIVLQWKERINRKISVSSNLYVSPNFPVKVDNKLQFH